MKLKLRKFDASEYLDNEEVVAEYLTAALEDANPKYFYRPLVMSPRRAE
jgi:DNA-binding phage protein